LNSTFKDFLCVLEFMRLVTLPARLKLNRLQSNRFFNCSQLIIEIWDVFLFIHSDAKVILIALHFGPNVKCYTYVQCAFFQHILHKLS